VRACVCININVHQRRHTGAAPGTEDNVLNDTTVDINSRYILLLDDETAVLQALSRVLKDRGHYCSSATTGEVLLETIDQASQTGIKYDLAILDIKIPDGMGGIETMQKMQKLDSEIPVISMSGYPVESLFTGDESEGFVGHLEKPFSADDMSAEIKRICATPRNANTQLQ